MEAIGRRLPGVAKGEDGLTITMHYVYLIKSVSNSEQKYVGITSDLKKRMLRHNNGQSPHTSKYKPWELVAYMAFVDKYKAYAFEKYLKTHSGRAFSTKRFW